MKRIIATILLALMLAGCGKRETPYFYEESSCRFTVIESQADYKIVVDTQTGVEYLMRYGNTTVLVDQNGQPYIANGWRDAD